MTTRRAHEATDPATGPVSSVTLLDNHFNRGPIAMLSHEAFRLYHCLLVLVDEQDTVTESDIEFTGHAHRIAGLDEARSELYKAGLLGAATVGYWVQPPAQPQIRPKGGRPPATGPAPTAEAARKRAARARTKLTETPDETPDTTPDGTGHNQDETSRAPAVPPSYRPTVQPSTPQPPEGLSDAAEPPEGYEDQGDGVWLSPDHTRAWTAADPVVRHNAVDEIRVRQLCQQVEGWVVGSRHSDWNPRRDYRLVRLAAETWPKLALADFDEAAKGAHDVEALIPWLCSQPKNREIACPVQRAMNTRLENERLRAEGYVQRGDEWVKPTPKAGTPDPRIAALADSMAVAP